MPSRTRKQGQGRGLHLTVVGRVLIFVLLLVTRTMIKERQALGTIKSELDEAFALVQSAKTSYKGREDTRVLARNRVASATKNVRSALSAAHLGESETRLVEAKLAALADAASRIS